MRALALALLAFAVLGAGLPDQGSLPVRLHHVHYRVGDPSEAMGEAIAKGGGSKEIVSGLGVGVRRGDDFLLFDRLTDEDPADVTLPTLTRAYDHAVAWLSARGITVEPRGRERIAQAPEGRYHHLAFATTAFEVAIGRLGTPISQRPDSALFDAGGVVVVEIVRETELPDAFWCPMHVDVRSPSAGKCPQCGMDLVPIPPPKVGEYKLDVTVLQTAKVATGVRLTVRDPDTNAIVTRFETVHDKLFHLFVVGSDLEYFAHIHPDAQRDGSFVLKHPFPPGEYMLIADFVPVGGTAQTLQRAALIGVRSRFSNPAGVRSRFSKEGGLENRDLTPREAREAREAVRETVVDGVRMALKAEDVVPGKEACLTFTLTDPKSGEPIRDLEPYLGAPAHMLMVRADLGDAIHAHPEELQTAGPTLSFHPLIPAEGAFKLWIQVQRAGRVITVPFWISAGR